MGSMVIRGFAAWMLLSFAASCQGESRPSHDMHQAFADYRACLAGGPLDPGEVLSERLADIGLAFSPASTEWPERCLALGEAVYSASEDEPIVRSALEGLRANPQHEDAAWGRADRLVTVDGSPTVVRPPAPVRTPESDSAPALALSGFGSHRVALARARSHSSHTRVLFRDPGVVDCEIDAGGAAPRARCRSLEVPSASDGTVYLADSELGAPLLFGTSDGSFLESESRVRRVGGYRFGGSFVAADGAVYLVEQDGRDHALVSWLGSERSVREIPSASQDYRESVLILDRRLLWVSGTHRDYRLHASDLTADPASSVELGTLEAGLRVARGCHAGWGRATIAWDRPRHDLHEAQDRAVRVWFEVSQPSEQAGMVSSVDTTLPKPRSTRSLIVFRNHGAEPQVVCTEEGVELHVVNAGTLVSRRCSPSGCLNAEVSLGGLGTRLRWAVMHDGKVLVVRTDRGLRARLAAPDALAEAHERFIARPADAREFHVQPVGDGAVIWLFDDRRLRAVYMSPSGELSSVQAWSE